MRRAMAAAEVGDDVYGEDPTVNRLEAEAAALVGKEAALFVPTGTMGNQIAVLTHTERGDEVILEQDAHIYYYEVGGVALLAGAQVQTIPSVAGRIDPAVLRAAVRPANIHFPTPRLFCFENTHNRAGGTVISPDLTRELCAVAHELGLKVHLDGARIFNAAVALGVDVKELTGPVDSVMFCLSKGLAAPVGSLLAGSREFIDRARKYRKVLGGGMRQAGVLAAAGLVALEEMIDRLALDHEHARQLAVGLAELPGIALDPEQVETNIVLFALTDGRSASSYVEELRRVGVLAVPMGPTQVRMVTHKDVTGADIQEALRRIASLH